MNFELINLVYLWLVFSAFEYCWYMGYASINSTSVPSEVRSVRIEKPISLRLGIAITSVMAWWYYLPRAVVKKRPFIFGF